MPCLIFCSQPAPHSPSAQCRLAWLERHMLYRRDLLALQLSQQAYWLLSVCKSFTRGNQPHHQIDRRRSMHHGHKAGNSLNQNHACMHIFLTSWMKFHQKGYRVRLRPMDQPEMCQVKEAMIPDQELATWLQSLQGRAPSAYGRLGICFDELQVPGWLQGKPEVFAEALLQCVSRTGQHSIVAGSTT